ncbi:2Fe-2S iron-sulfur cluster-binding protein [Pseudoroseomonas wenyumeiae]
MTLLQALRGPLGLSGPRFGCGAEACGACYVTLDGQPQPSCALPAEAAQGRQVGTVEGLGTLLSPTLAGRFPGGTGGAMRLVPVRHPGQRRRPAAAEPGPG